MREAPYTGLPADNLMADWIGQLIGKYRIKELIGRGKMGKVYRAHQPNLERDVAIKINDTAMGRDPSVIGRFRQEARVVASLRHPGIVHVYDFDIIDDAFYMVMECIEGHTLKDRLVAVHNEGERLPLPRALRLFQQIVDAVSYAHSRGVVHRDLKPANVLLTGHDQPILVDFGLSKILGEQSRLTVPGVIMGTPAYMSPEQCSGRSSDERSDVYTLGVMLYEITTATQPFSADTPFSVILKHISEEPVSPRSINPELPRALEHVIQKAMAKDPTERYSSAQKLQQAMAALGLFQSPSATAEHTLIVPPTTSDGRCPYRGLQAFEAEHTEFFFGREGLVDQILSKLETQIAAQKNRFLAVLGASGSGKSSLVRAGVIPALEQDEISGSGKWSIRVLKPGPQPLEALAAQVADSLTKEEKRAAMTRQLLTFLTNDGWSLHLAVRMAWAKAPPDRRLLLVVDQFEEIFTLCQDDAQRQRFIESLLYAATVSDGRVIVVITMRADFYHRCAAYRNLAHAISTQQVLVGPMSQSDLRRAIEQPARRVDLKFEPGLVDVILADVAQQPGALPLLQHALLELWDQRQQKSLTLTAYQTIGRVSGAIAQRADTTYESFDENEQTIMRRVMLRLTQLGQGTEDTRRRVQKEELLPVVKENSPNQAQVVENVLQRLADARLVTITRDMINSEEYVDVAHEALIQGWDRLRNWLDDNREAIRVRVRLTQAAEEWQQNNYDESYLYRGARLAEAEEWSSQHLDELNVLEREFLQVCLIAQARAEAEKQARQRRELEVVRNTASNLRQLTDTIKVEREKSQQQLQCAISRQLAAQAFIWRDKQLDLALLLSVQAQHIADTVEARSSLLATVDHNPALTTYLRGHTAPVAGLAYNVDGSQLVSCSWDNSALVWDSSTGQQIIQLNGHRHRVQGVALAPTAGSQPIATASSDKTIRLWQTHNGQIEQQQIDYAAPVLCLAYNAEGSYLAAGLEDGTVVLWSLIDCQVITTFKQHTDAVTSVAFSPDGTQLASASRDQTVNLWDVTKRESRAILNGHSNRVYCVAFNPKGTCLASGAADNTVILWDAEHGTPIATLEGHKRAVKTLAFSPDGTILATGSFDTTLILWDLATHHPTTTLKGHTGGIYSVAFRPDGLGLASGGFDHTIILWDLSPGKTHPFSNHNVMAASMAFSPDGTTLVSASADGAVRVWDVATRQIKSILTRHKTEVRSVAFSPDGQHIASGGYDGETIMWDIESGEALMSLTAHRGTVEAVQFSPDGMYLASASADQTIILWETTTGREVAQLRGHTRTVEDLAFSPDGLSLASASEDNTVVVWDLSEATNPKPRFTLRRHANGVGSVAIRMDGRILASGSGDGKITLWNMSDGQRLASTKGHLDWVMSLAFSSDGRYLASGSADNTVVIWNIAALIDPHSADETVWLHITDFSSRVWSVAFSSDGRDLIVSTQDGQIRLWNMDADTWPGRACQRANRTLTRDEWSRFVGLDIPYQP